MTAWFSVTDIDSYRYLMSLDEPPSIQELRARLFERGPPNEAAMAGSALHKALDTSTYGEHDHLAVGGYTFTGHNLVVEQPRVRELRTSKTYRVNGIDVRLYGRVDGLLGLTVYDHKTSDYSLDAEAHWETYQWRFYLDMLEAERFVWQFFEWGPTPRDSVYATTPGVRWIKSAQLLEQYAYDGMQRDIERTLSEFVDMARQVVPERFA